MQNQNCPNWAYKPYKIGKLLNTYRTIKAFSLKRIGHKTVEFKLEMDGDINLYQRLDFIVFLKDETIFGDMYREYNSMYIEPPTVDRDGWFKVIGKADELIETMLDSLFGGEYHQTAGKEIPMPNWNSETRITF